MSIVVRLLALLALLICPLVVRAQFFADVRQGDADFQCIGDAGYHQLMEGMPNGVFDPDRPVTRAESVMVQARLLNIALRGFMVLPGPALPAPHFADVPDTHWMQAAARFLAERGMLFDAGHSRFRPTTPMSRGEFVAALYRIMHAGKSVTPSHAMQALIDAYLAPAAWMEQRDTPILRREVARVTEACLYYLTQHAVTEGDIIQFEIDDEQKRWAILETDIGECRLYMPARGILLTQGTAQDLRVGARVRTLSDAISSMRDGKYYRVREVTIIATAP